MKHAFYGKRLSYGHKTAEWRSHSLLARATFVILYTSPRGTHVHSSYALRRSFDSTTTTTS